MPAMLTSLSERKQRGERRRGVQRRSKSRHSGNIPPSNRRGTKYDTAQDDEPPTPAVGIKVLHRIRIVSARGGRGSARLLFADVLLGDILLAERAVRAGRGGAVLDVRPLRYRGIHDSSSEQQVGGRMPSPAHPSHLFNHSTFPGTGCGSGDSLGYVAMLRIRLAKAPLGPNLTSTIGSEVVDNLHAPRNGPAI